MTRFESIGVARQMDANSIREANSRFLHSCGICSSRGVNISCDHCAIRFCHEETVACFRDFLSAPQPERSAS